MYRDWLFHSSRSTVYVANCTIAGIARRPLIWPCLHSLTFCTTKHWGEIILIFLFLFAADDDDEEAKWLRFGQPSTRTINKFRCSADSLVYLIFYTPAPVLYWPLYFTATFCYKYIWLRVSLHFFPSQSVRWEFFFGAQPRGDLGGEEKISMFTHFDTNFQCLADWSLSRVSRASGKKKSIRIYHSRAAKLILTFLSCIAFLLRVKLFLRGGERNIFLIIIFHCLLRDPHTRDVPDH